MSKLYQHYKGPYYRKIAEARHSETGEDVVFYEPLYDTPAKYWVRPKEMFHGSVEGPAGSMDRFAQVQTKIDSYEELKPDVLDGIWPLVVDVFPDMDRAKLATILERHSRFLVQIARVNDEPVGFKIGYEDRPSAFYSYLGGVKPEWHRLGIASQLMVAQHDWAASKGYKLVRAKTVNSRLSMLQLSLQFGFQIYGTELKPDGRLMVLLEKSLNPG